MIREAQGIARTREGALRGMFRSSLREQKIRKGGRSSQNNMLKGQRPEKAGNTLGISRTSLWWECEYEGIVAREGVRKESREQILEDWVG